MTGRQRAPGCVHRELAVGWALHTLEPAEEILVAAHLRGCSECTRTLAETELVGAVLGLSVPESIPSAELEQRVLAVTTVAQVSPMPPPPAPATAGVTDRPPRPPPVSPLRQAPRRRRRQEPSCTPETLMLISIALLVFTVTFALLLYAIP